MATKIKAIPDGYHSITPSFCITGCDKAIAFYKKIFGAEEKVLMRGPDGGVVHCELQIGDSIVMFGEASARQPAYSLHSMLYVTDCDAVFKAAVDNGATVVEGLTNQFYGDRSGRVTDPFGNHWYIATHIEDVSPEEMDKRMKAMMAGGPPA